MAKASDPGEPEAKTNYMDALKFFRIFKNKSVYQTGSVMKAHYTILTVALLFAFSLARGQSRNQHPELRIEQPQGPKPWTNLNINDKPGQFQFVVVTDRTGGHRPGVFEKGVEKINLLQPEFVMSVGDMIEGYTTDTVEINRQWDEFTGFVNKLEMPFFFVPGNHDLTNPVMEQIWRKRFGPTHYSFVYKDVLFMALNSEDQTRGAGRGSISKPQLDWIKQTLESHREVKWTFLFMHQPLWAQGTDPVHWFDVEKLLADRRHTVFVGHRHHYTRFERNNSQYYMLATTGGSSRLRGPQLGEFDHFVWVTMTDHGPILANLHLEGVFDHDVFNEELATFSRKVWESNLIQVEPLYVNDATFRHDSIRFRITNPFDVPVKVKMTQSFSWDFKSDIATPEFTLQPNSVEFVSMELTARRTKSPESMKPVKVKAEVAVQEEGKLDFFIPFDLNVAPLKRYALSKASGKFKVDGELNDWASLPYTLDTPEGARFGVAWNDKFLRLAVQVNDSEILNDAGGTTTRQDYVGFVVDAQPLKKSAASKGERGYLDALYFLVSPEDGKGKNSISGLGDNEKDLRWKCIRNKEGYAFEIAVPLSYIQQQQGNAWQTVRVNVVVQDRDSKSSKRVWWQPDWSGRDNVVGSGMFFRDENGRTVGGE